MQNSTPRLPTDLSLTERDVLRCLRALIVAEYGDAWYDYYDLEDAAVSLDQLVMDVRATVERPDGTLTRGSLSDAQLAVGSLAGRGLIALPPVEEDGVPEVILRGYGFQCALIVDAEALLAGQGIDLDDREVLDVHLHRTMVVFRLADGEIATCYLAQDSEDDPQVRACIGAGDAATVDPEHITFAARFAHQLMANAHRTAGIGPSAIARPVVEGGVVHILVEEPDYGGLDVTERYYVSPTGHLGGPLAKTRLAWLKVWGMERAREQGVAS